MGVSYIRVNNLVVNHVKGEYYAKEVTLINYLNKFLKKFKEVQLSHALRAEKTKADKLAKPSNMKASSQHQMGIFHII